jgi:hypothetical protein
MVVLIQHRVRPAAAGLRANASVNAPGFLA